MPGSLVEKVRAAAQRLTGFQLFGVGLSWRPTPVAAEECRRAEEPGDDDFDLNELELEDAQESALLAIARSRAGALDIRGVSRSLRVGKLVAEHHLEVLEALELVLDAEEEGSFELTPVGRAYLVGRELVQ